MNELAVPRQSSSLYSKHGASTTPSDPAAVEVSTVQTFGSKCPDNSKGAKEHKRKQYRAPVSVRQLLSGQMLPDTPNYHAMQE